MHVLYEDNHLLVVVKPPGLITQGAAADEESLVTQAKAYLKQKYAKPGNVYLGVVSRLDAPASGAIVLARTSKAAERLSAQFRDRDVAKRYWALVSGAPPQHGELRDWLVKDERQQKVMVTSADTRDAREAVLTYRVRQRWDGGAWLEVDLHTGRKHQIRVQLASRGWPILGDAKYGSRATFPTGIALHAATLAFVHPTSKQPLSFDAPLPPAWSRYVKGSVTT